MNKQRAPILAQPLRSGWFFLLTVCLAVMSVPVQAAPAQTDAQYRLALQYKKKGLWRQAVPMMQRLAARGHIGAKTDLARMLLPIRSHDADTEPTRFSFTDEAAALALLDDAVASGYGPAMLTSGDWHSDHAAYRCKTESCRVQHLTQAKQLHESAAGAGEHQGFAWLAYFYATFCAGDAARVSELRQNAIDLFRVKRPRVTAEVAKHWFAAYGVFTGGLQQIDVSEPAPLCR